MELNQDNLQELEKNGFKMSNLDVKQVNEINNIKLKEPKSFIKGGRLYMYPPKFNLYRISRGIKKPTKEFYSYHVAKEKIGLTNPTFSTGYSLTDSVNSFTNKVIYEYYNTNVK